MNGAQPKELVWVGPSRRDLREFPVEAQRVVGYALYLARMGEKHPDAKPLKGFHGAGVLEVVDEFEGNAYRAVYTVRLGDAVYVLHAFQKKANKGIATPKREMELIRQRYEQARRIHDERQGSRK